MYSFIPPRLKWINLHLLVLVYHVYLHVSLCLDLSGKLVRFLFHGTWMWISMAVRLLLFTALIGPGWYHLVTYFVFSPKVVRNLAYSSKGVTSRNYLDIYLPPSVTVLPENSIQNSSKMKRTVSYTFQDSVPVVIFVSGGAWIIGNLTYCIHLCYYFSDLGYKLWSSLAARALSALGTVVVCPDYRNAPQGSIDDMMTDISLAIRWTIRNIADYGGNNDQIILAGQSAGAHIGVSLILNVFNNLMNLCDGTISPNAITDVSAKSGASPAGSDLSIDELKKIRLIVGVSGPYNLHVLQKHLHKRGLDTSLLSWICNDDVDRYSPTLVLRRMNSKLKEFNVGNDCQKRRLLRSAAKLPVNFPPIALYHGSNDKTVPSSISEEFAEELKKCNLDVSLQVYNKLSHTDLILEGPLTGNNQLLKDMITMIEEKCCIPYGTLDDIRRKNSDDCIELERPFAPKWLVKIAREMNPF